MKQKFLLLIFSALLLSPTCSKEIALPDPELKKIFGKWEWVESSGGFAGKIITPEQTGHASSIEFSSRGVYQYFKDNALTDRKHFSITEGKSIYTGGTAFIVSYSINDSLFRGSLQNQSVSFKGSDTLLLKEECHDCFSTVWVKKK